MSVLFNFVLTDITFKYSETQRVIKQYHDIKIINDTHHRLANLKTIYVEISDDNIITIKVL